MTDAISEDRIVAYVDGELDAAGRAEVEAVAAADPAVAARLDAHRALRDRLAGAFGAILAEPVPQALIDAATAPPAEVIAFTPRAPSRAFWMQAAAMAACLVAGIVLASSFGGNRGDVTARSGLLIAHGDLARALSTQLASDTAGPVRVALTFRDHSGAVCRTFWTSAMDGLACRDTGEWRIDATARHQDEGTYRQASSPLITAAAQDAVEGDVFDAAAETRARSEGWKTIPPAK